MNLNPLSQKHGIDTIEQRALAYALHNLDSLAFDPSGRVLIEVDCRDLASEGFTPNVTVSLDVKTHPDLKQAFIEQFGAQMIDNPKRGSIIGLQQEMYFHLGLAARTYTQINEVLYPERLMKEAHAKAMERVNILVREAYKSAEAAATNNGVIDTVQLVKALDSVRATIAATAQIILIQEIYKVTGHYLDPNDIREKHPANGSFLQQVLGLTPASLPDETKLQQYTESTTATANDLLYIDSDLGLKTLIGGSEVTAHDRGTDIEANLADRAISSFSDLSETPPHLRIRIPSLDAKSGLPASTAIEDVEKKLEHLSTKYALADRITDNPLLARKAFTYNLLTAINQSFDGSNKQSEGANYILRAAHQFNAKRLLDNGPLCFVQNISVNGWGDTLGYSSNPLQTEATLMSEMALLYNLGCKVADQQLYGEVFTAYAEFLRLPAPKPAFFSASEQGQAAMEAIRHLKNNWAILTTQPQNTDDNMLETAKNALRVMMAHDLHHKHEYAKTITALSVFIEEASLIGCKSGNERTQAILGRVCILDRLNHLPDGIRHENPIFVALHDLSHYKSVRGPLVNTLASAFKDALDSDYDNHLQAAASLVSLVDQGATSKIEARRTLFNTTNHGEEPSLSHLHQTKASTMQAHKGMAAMMLPQIPVAPHEVKERKRFLQDMLPDTVKETSYVPPRTRTFSGQRFPVVSEPTLTQSKDASNAPQIETPGGDDDGLRPP